MNTDPGLGHVVLSIHLLVGAFFLVLSGAQFTAGQAVPAVLRAAIGVLVVFAGVYIFRTQDWN